VIPAVLIYWLTQGLPDWFSKKPADPVATQSIDGRVIDGAAQRLLAGAAVLLELGGVTTSDTTDSLGRYLFVAKAVPPAAAVLTVRAAGYRLYSLNLAIKSDLTQDIALEPEPPPAQPPPATAPTGTHVPLQFPIEHKIPATQALKPALPTVRLMTLAISTPYTRRQLSTAVKAAPAK
jgi:hypothetical protein